MRGIARRFIRLRELTAFPHRVSNAWTSGQARRIRVCPRSFKWVFRFGARTAWERKPMRKLVPLLAAAVVLPTAVHAAVPARPAAGKAPGILRQLNGALSQLADRVSPAVVQIQVSGYGLSSSDDGHEKAAFFVRQHVVVSGVIVDPAGYIVTNAHVVQGAQRIMVVLPAATQGLRQESPKRRVYPARLVGAHRESDLAVLKIDAGN